MTDETMIPPHKITLRGGDDDGLVMHIFWADVEAVIGGEPGTPASERQIYLPSADNPDVWEIQK
jgi:hypothetical protein